MRTAAAVVAIPFVAACGGFDEGTYDVTLRAGSDDCGLEDVADMKQEWAFTDLGDGEWRLTFEDATEAEGKESGGGDSIAFHQESEGENPGSGCWLTENDGLTIKPDGDNFTGSLIVNLYAEMCDDPVNDGSSCESNFSVRGEKQQ